MKPLILPVFIPNEGCPHRCLFCDQRRISGAAGHRADLFQIRRFLDSALSKTRPEGPRRFDVAFYGGTFTGLPLPRMTELLESVAPYIESGRVRAVRVSTRPDAVDPARLDLMRRYGVETVELGVQSMDDAVLGLSRRGHTRTHTARAVDALTARGFAVGIQLMPGLPGDSPAVFRTTVTQCLALRPRVVRLYPAVVVEGTPMERHYRSGAYRPWSLETAVEACAEACARFEEAGIAVIRMGLLDTPSLSDKGRILAGPWHPAFGFLVRSRIRKKALERVLPPPGETKRIRIYSRTREIPLVRGYRNEGVRWIEEKTGAKVAGVTSDDTLPCGKVRIEKI